MTIEEYIAGITDPHQKALAELWLPVLQRWVYQESWDQVRQWIYAWKGNSLQWWMQIRSKMTTEEARAEDKRRLALVKQYQKQAFQLASHEQALIQQIITGLLNALLAKI